MMLSRTFAVCTRGLYFKGNVVHAKQFCSTTAKTVEQQVITTNSVSNKMYTTLTAGAGTILANVCYGVMRAKDRGSLPSDKPNGSDTDQCIRTFSFIFGFPFSVLTYVCVKEGSNKLFGLSLEFLD